ncbi:MAG: hypothetical protein ACKO3Q_03240 [Betaproteobacteria bacterium]
MPAQRLPAHIKEALLRVLHAPDERVPRYTIVWSEGDVHLEVAYLTDAEQQQRLLTQLSELRERVEDGEFIDGVRWTVFFPERADGSYGEPLVLGNPSAEELRRALDKARVQREGLASVEWARMSSRADD